MTEDDPAPLYPSDPPEHSLAGQLAELRRQLARFGRTLLDHAPTLHPRRPPP